MELFCRACDCNHALTSEELERVVYALEAYICDSMTDAHLDDLHKCVAMDGAISLCLLEVYKTTRIEGGYLEYAHLMTELRLSRQRGPRWDRRLGVYVNKSV